MLNKSRMVVRLTYFECVAEPGQAWFKGRCLSFKSSKRITDDAMLGMRGIVNLKRRGLKVNGRYAT